MTDDILIIGGGVAGLTAGCYARMNGYRTTILEQHTLPGGLCTSWSRKGYTFDYSIAFLMGVAPGSDIHRMWEELGALRGRSIRFFAEFGRVSDETGKVLIGYTDPDRLEQHMLELSPADGKLIREFTGAIRLLARRPITPPSRPAELLTRGERLRQILYYIPLGRYVGRFGAITTESFARQFKDPFLRKVFPRIFTWPGVPMLGVIMTLAGLHARTAGKPSGGSLSFAQAIAQRYTDLGGKIRYGARAAQVVVENDRAVGVRLEDGTELRANLVISAADLRKTVFEMLGEQYVSDDLLAFVLETPVYRPIVQVSLGVARDFSGQPESLVCQADQPLMNAGEKPTAMAIKHFCSDPGMAPKGKSAVVVEYAGDYAFWKQLSETPEQYRLEKQRVAEGAIALLERHYPGVRAQIEVVDVATPVTAEHYTGSSQGSPMGWNPPVTAGGVSAEELTRSLPGLANFYMVGQWAPSGGVPAVATWARNLVQLICHRDGRPFVTSLPDEEPVRVELAG